jgi:DHA1 family tetracycline resistance protein-like MFS transporter
MSVAPASENPMPQEPVAPKGALLTIFLIVFVDLLGFGIIIPLLPFYIPNPQEHPYQVAALFSVYSICQLIGAPVLGILSDRYGRRPILIASQVGSAIGYALLGWVSLQDWRATTAGLALIYLSRIIDGFSGGNISTAQAYISDVTTGENRAKGMGLLGAAFGIGFTIGPALGGILAHYWNPSAPAFAAAVFSACAGILTWARLPESRVHKPVDAELWLHPSVFKPVFRNRVLTQLLAISFIAMAAFVMMETVIAMYLARHDTFGWDIGKVGWFLAFAGFIIVIVQGGLIGRMTKALGEWPLAVAGPLLVAVGMALFTSTGFWPIVGVLMLAGAANASGRSFQQPTISALISKYSDRESQGVVFGLYHALGSVARVIGPAIAGFAYARHPTGPFVTAGVLVLVAAAWTAALRASVPAPAAVPGGFPVEQNPTSA